ncbi:MAG: methyltransferase domain-containing protein [Sphingobacteriales bacterium]
MVLQYKDVFHKLKKSHGPFNLYICKNCGSSITLPLPGIDNIKDFYTAFDKGLPAEMQSLRSQSPLNAWYNQCISSAVALVDTNVVNNKNICWIDAGAGDGILSKIMAERFPLSKGYAIDYHERPALLKGINNVEWISIDANNNDEDLLAFTGKADVIFLISVVEHLIYPGDFLEKILLLLKEKGSLYLVTPDYNSVTRKVMGKSWPFYLPGEHINIPSVKGIEILLKRIMAETKEPVSGRRVYSRKISVAYPIKYYFNFFGLKLIAKLIPARWTIKLPIGGLEAGFYFTN